ncbi:MAG: ArsR/SmtB family transcription factor [Salinirussus sp.]
MNGTQVGRGRTESTPETGELIELLNDDYAREIMGRIHDQPKAARPLAEECGVSRATVYRRLNRLEAAGLVEEGMRYDSDGHHRKVFSLTVDSASIELGESGFEVDVDRRQPA